MKISILALALITAASQIHPEAIPNAINQKDFAIAKDSAIVIDEPLLCQSVLITYEELKGLRQVQQCL